MSSWKEEIRRRPIPWLMGLVLSAGICFPALVAADEGESLEEKLAAYEEISIAVEDDELMATIQKKERALDELGRLYGAAAREADTDDAAEKCFRLAELRRKFATEVQELDNPFDEGSEDHSSFEQDVQFMASHGQLMEASSSQCGYQSVIDAAQLDGAPPQLAIEAYEAWHSIRPQEAERHSATIEEIRQKMDSDDGDDAEESADSPSCSSGESCENAAMEHRRQRDDEAFVELIGRACELEARRCGHMAYLNLFGVSGVERDMEASQKYFERACEGGDRESCMSLAQYLGDGIGFEKDEQASEKFFDKACQGMDRQECLQQFEARPD